MERADIDKRILLDINLYAFEKEVLEDCFCVIYANQKTTFFFDGRGLTEDDRKDLIKKFIGKMQSGANFSRDIVAQSKNIYFVY